MDELNALPALGLLLPVVVVLLLGLPVMCGWCVWRAVVCDREGDEAMSRSWADAAKSFGGMMLGSWVLYALGHWVVGRGLDALAQMQRGG